MPFLAFGQNLISNGNFEQYYSCPNGIGQLTKANKWQSLNTGTPEYFNANCGFFDFIDSSGSGYLGLILHSQYTEAIEYFGQKLTVPLSSGLYSLKFKIRPRKGPFYCNNFGVIIRQGEVKLNYWGRWKESPIFNIDTVISSNQWQEFQFEFYAKGGEDFIAFGNFLHEDYIKLKVDKAEKVTDGWQSYYYVDDIELTSLEPKSIEIANEIEKPNKALTIYFDVNSYQIAENFKDSLIHFIQDRTSKKIISIELIGHTDVDGSNDYNLNLSLNRVMAVKNYLSEMFPEQFEYILIPKGETAPLNDNATNEQKALNRRVIVKFE